MDEKTFKKTVTALSNPVVQPFIDAQRVAKSATYQDLVVWAVAHHKQSGDHTYLVRALDIVSKNTIYLPTLKWITDLAGLKYSLADDYNGKNAAMSFKFAKHGEGKAASLDAYTQKYRGTRRQVVAQLSAYSVRKERKLKRKRSVDAMNRWLPGSFESGKLTTWQPHPESTNLGTETLVTLAGGLLKAALMPVLPLTSSLA